jgi:hypothetical protein
MTRTALQSAVIGGIASALALWARYGMRWWPASPLEKAAFFAGCPACPIDVAGRRPEIHAIIGFVILCGGVYALLGMGLEAARRMRRGETGGAGDREIG